MDEKEHHNLWKMEDVVKRMQVLQELYYLLLGDRVHLTTLNQYSDLGHNILYPSTFFLASILIVGMVPCDERTLFQQGNSGELIEQRGALPWSSFKYLQNSQPDIIYCFMVGLALSMINVEDSKYG